LPGGASSFSGGLVLLPELNLRSFTCLLLCLVLFFDLFATGKAVKLITR
jgi:hypothetical protein